MMIVVMSKLILIELTAAGKKWCVQFVLAEQSPVRHYAQSVD